MRVEESRRGRGVGLIVALALAVASCGSGDTIGLGQALNEAAGAVGNVSSSSGSTSTTSSTVANLDETLEPSDASPVESSTTAKLVGPSCSEAELTLPSQVDEVYFNPMIDSCDGTWAVVSYGISSNDIGFVVWRAGTQDWEFVLDLAWTADFDTLGPDAEVNEALRVRDELAAIGLPQATIDQMVPKPDPVTVRTLELPHETIAYPDNAPEGYIPELIGYCVVDVASDDVLNLRSGAGVANGIVFGIPFNSCDVSSAYPVNVARIGEALWYEVVYADHAFVRRGWVNAKFLQGHLSPCGWDSEYCGL